MNKRKTDNSLTHILDSVLGYIRSNSILLVIIASVFGFLVLATYLGFLEVNSFRQLNVSDFEVGKVAERDVVASREVSFIDENATRIRREARQRLVTAVFKYDRSLSNSLLSDYSDFVEYMDNTMQTASSVSQFLLEVQQEYPGILEKKTIQTLYNSPDRSGILSVSHLVFKQIINEGITAFPDKGMENFNQSDIELVHWKNDRQERIEVPKDSLLTWNELRTYVSNALVLMKKNSSMTDILMSLIRPFLKENLIYQAEESETKLEAAVRQVTPVMVVIPKGQKIIKRGFLITEESYNQLEALANSGVYIDVRQFTGAVICLFIVILVAVYMLSSGILGMQIEFKDRILLIVCFFIEYLVVFIFSKMQFFTQSLDIILVMPTALLSMLVAILVSRRVGVCMSFILSLAVLCATGFTSGPFLFSLFSGITGVSAIRISGKRLDLVASSCILALVQPLLVNILLVVFSGAARDATLLAIGSAVNGFMSGILLLGFLPILESLLNSSTSFRLMEFSDLNSPVMKKMLLSISGTYNHSIMVATLAESACREIGADPLIARVGAYYHDIGKMDQSEYFVENQTDYNKHLDLNPRLSATVIRSHVKQGVEKARQLRLPKEVIDIISEHHGNSLITYFYNEAKKLNDAADPEDYMYQGIPPRSKESAVVMLADVVEAACRTLEKPTVPRLEKFINDLVGKKIESNQLDNSDLTFREIGIIKKSFVNILAGYYHSRIEYPNQKDPDDLVILSREAALKRKES